MDRSVRRILVAMVTDCGTACTETVLTQEEDTPERRKEIEQQFCHGRLDNPVAGSWTGVTYNDDCQALFQDNDDG